MDIRLISLIKDIYTAQHVHAIISLAFIITELFFFMDKRDIYEKFNNFEILKSTYSYVKSILKLLLNIYLHLFY